MLMWKTLPDGVLTPYSDESQWNQWAWDKNVLYSASDTSGETVMALEMFILKNNHLLIQLQLVLGVSIAFGGA